MSQDITMRATPRSPADVRVRLEFWQAVTGGCLALFVAVHLLLEGSVVISPSITNWIGWIMEEAYLAQVAAPAVLMLILVHFWLAARKMPFRAGEARIFISHSRALRDLDTWLWLVQIASAIIILFGAFFHIYGIMTELPITVESSHLRLHGGWILFYTVFLPATILHTGIGIYRIGVKYGIISGARRCFWRKAIWAVMGCYFLLGCCALTRVWFYAN